MDAELIHIPFYYHGPEPDLAESELLHIHVMGRVATNHPYVIRHHCNISTSPVVETHILCNP